MAEAIAKAEAFTSPEYSVYIYHRPENQHEGQNDWEMRTITPDLKFALDEAEALYESKGYRKVEVKQRVVDYKTDKIHDHTLKIFSSHKKTVFVEFWFCALGLSLIGVGILLMFSGLF